MCVNLYDWNCSRYEWVQSKSNGGEITFVITPCLLTDMAGNCKKFIFTAHKEIDSHEAYYRITTH